MQNTSEITIFSAILKKGSPILSFVIYWRGGDVHVDRQVGAPFPR